MPQADGWLSTEALVRCRDAAGFSEARFPADRYDLATRGFGARPSPHQQVNFLLTPDQTCQCRSAQCLEPAGDSAGTEHLPHQDGGRDALDLDRTEVAVLEQITEQPARAWGDHDGFRLGQCLQPGGEFGRFADDRLLLRRAFPNQVADNDQPGGNPDTRFELDGFDIETSDSLERRSAPP